MEDQHRNRTQFDGLARDHSPAELRHCVYLQCEFIEGINKFPASDIAPPLGLSLQSLELIGHDRTQLIDLGLQFIRCHGDGLTRVAIR